MLRDNNFLISYYFMILSTSDFNTTINCLLTLLHLKSFVVGIQELLFNP